MNNSLLKIGYDGDGMIVLVIDGTVDNKPFQTIIKLDKSQTWKLSEDLKLTINQMEADQVRA
jgi:hypothetical protein